MAAEDCASFKYYATQNWSGCESGPGLVVGKFVCRGWRARVQVELDFMGLMKGSRMNLFGVDQSSTKNVHNGIKASSAVSKYTSVSLGLAIVVACGGLHVQHI